ncbi:hypothetical protein [Coleofasciculus sp.]|uniref:hypothetical protein n=1 Tax=Coleofasciculus sp. TaxID=3100458 RepID=UPI003A2F15B8
MNLMDTPQAFLEQCLMVTFSSFLAVQLFGRTRFQSCLIRDRLFLLLFHRILLGWGF